MGYAVYEDRDAHDRGVERWAGYGIPAVCDHPWCSQEIDRGFAYKCGEVGDDNFGDHHGGDCTGCGMYFCEQHRFGDHHACTPKPDVLEWIQHVLTDDSWQQWLTENPRRAAEYRARFAAEAPAAPGGSS